MKYEEAGVSISKANELVSWLKGKASIIGSFSAKVKVGNEWIYLSTDGIGTKILLYIEYGKYEGIGDDLVAMVSNDILADGGRMIYLLDYYATFLLKNEIAKIVLEDVIRACRKIGADLIGGETAELPGIINEGVFDIAGFGVGVPIKEEFERVEVGDVIIGFPSSGFHSNGYSLLRKIIRDRNLDIFKVYKELDESRTLGEILLTPTRLYTDIGIDLYTNFGAKRGAHITGGGIYENLPRALDGNGFRIYIDNIPTPEYMKTIIRWGNIPEDEAYRVFNMGVGFAFVVRRDKVDGILEKYPESFILGEVI